ncbi:MAG: methyltransferase [Bdellovibrionales bacterium]|nr:methyltransferase [Bdellovibrionales bacterium]
MQKLENIIVPQLSEAAEAVLEARHLALLQQMRGSEPNGRIVTHLGKEFHVLQNVFPPYDDSVSLINHFQITPGEEVLDVGSGSGVLSVFAAARGAGRVLALDINPDAVRNTRVNAERHSFSDRIEARESDLFSAVARHEKFDVVVANLPFRNKEADDMPSRSIWDTHFMTHRRFFSGVRNVLLPHGRIYMVHSSFGDLERFAALASRAGFHCALLDTHEIPGAESRTYYVFELSKH